jgi:hypothetical protein
LSRTERVVSRPMKVPTVGQPSSAEASMQRKTWPLTRARLLTVGVQVVLCGQQAKVHGVDCNRRCLRRDGGHYRRDRQPTRGPPTVRLACQEQHIPGNTLLEKWEFCQQHGFDGIELRGHDGVPLPSVQVVADMFHMNIEESDPPRRSATPVPA